MGRRPSARRRRPPRHEPAERRPPPARPLGGPAPRGAHRSRRRDPDVRARSLAPDGRGGGSPARGACRAVRHRRVRARRAGRSPLHGGRLASCRRPTPGAHGDAGRARHALSRDGQRVCAGQDARHGREPCGGGRRSRRGPGSHIRRLADGRAQWDGAALRRHQRTGRGSRRAGGLQGVDERVRGPCRRDRGPGAPARRSASRIARPPVRARQGERARELRAGVGGHRHRSRPAQDDEVGGGGQGGVRGRCGGRRHGGDRRDLRAGDVVASRLQPAGVVAPFACLRARGGVAGTSRAPHPPRG